MTTTRTINSDHYFAIYDVIDNIAAHYFHSKITFTLHDYEDKPFTITAKINDDHGIDIAKIEEMTNLLQLTKVLEMAFNASYSNYRLDWSIPSMYH